MKSYNILYFITSTSIGGTEKMLFETVTRVNKTIFSPRVCSLKKKGSYATRIESEKVEVISLEVTDTSMLRSIVESIRALFKLVRLLRKERIAILHCYLFRANFLGRIAGRVAGVPIIISSIRTIEREKRYQLLLDRMTSFMVDRYVAVSQAVKDFSVDHGIPAKKCVVIYNGVDLTTRGSRTECVKLREELKITSYDHILLTIGRLRAEKGYGVLLRSLMRMREKVPSLKLLMVGKGEEELHLKRYSQQHRLDDLIVFMGEREHVGKLLSLADIVVLSSLWEGMPNVLLEAMAAGKPVVATQVGGVPEVVVQGETGILVPPGDADALAHALIELLQDREKAQRMGSAGRVRAERHFDVRSMVENTEKVYRELLQERGLL